MPCIIALVGGIMLYALATRSSIGVNVLHERNPLYVLLADGSVRNDYTVRILNKGADRKFRLEVSGLPGAALHVAGIERAADGTRSSKSGTDQTREIRLSVQVAGATDRPNSTDIEIKVTDTATGNMASVEDHFVSPKQ